MLFCAVFDAECLLFLSQTGCVFLEGLYWDKIITNANSHQMAPSWVGSFMSLGNRTSNVAAMYCYRQQQKKPRKKKAKTCDTVDVSMGFGQSSWNTPPLLKNSHGQPQASCSTSLRSYDILLWTEQGSTSQALSVGGRQPSKARGRQSHSLSLSLQSKQRASLHNIFMCLKIHCHHYSNVECKE